MFERCREYFEAKFKLPLFFTFLRTVYYATTPINSFAVNVTTVKVKHI